MSVPPRVSVVLPVYNAEAYLVQAIESILSQTYRNFEILALDDGSTDRSYEMLMQLSKKDSRVKAFANDHQGYVTLLNKGLRQSQSEIIARMDADDIALPNRFARQIEFLDQHPEVVAVGGAAELFDSTGNILGYLRPPLTIVPGQFLNQCPMAHPTVIFRREPVLALGGYHSALCPAEDFELWVRLARTYHLANLDEVVLRYRITEGQTSTRRASEQIICTIAIRQASRLWNQTGRDELEHVPKVTHQTLFDLGLTQPEINAQMLLEFLERIDNLLNMGSIKEAALMIEMCDQLKLPQSSGELNWRKAKVRHQQGHRVFSAMHLFRSLLSQPSRVIQFIRAVKKVLH